MTTLTKEQSVGSGGVFSLTNGQTHSRHRRVQNCGWYNKSGEQLSQGDLSTKDMLRIVKEIEQEELFIVLSEGDANLCLDGGGLDKSAPGVAYVTQHASHVITKDCVFVISEWSPPCMELQQLGDKGFFILDRKRARQLIETGKLPD